MNVIAYQEKEKNEETKKGKRRTGEKKSENRRPILKKLCAALLRSFRGQRSEKMKGSARGNWDPREGQQPFQSNPNGVGDRTTTFRRLLICAAQCLFAKRGEVSLWSNGGLKIRDVYSSIRDVYSSIWSKTRLKQPLKIVFSQKKFFPSAIWSKNRLS